MSDTPKKSTAKKSTATPKTAAVKTAAKAEAPAKKVAAKKTTAAAVEPKVAAAAKHEPTHAEISQRAYEIFQRRGHSHGNHHNDWKQAEHELKGA